MAMKLIKVFFLVIGLLACLDALLPTKTSTREIDHLAKRKTFGSEYVVAFKDQQSRCITDLKTVEQLKPGDNLTISRARITDLCSEIQKNNELIFSRSYWRLLYISLGLFAIAWALGWIDTERWWGVLE